MSATLKKLRYADDMRVGVFGAPAAFEAELAAATGFARLKRGGKNLDLVQAFFTRKGQLERDVPGLAASVAAGGILWICYPKGRALGTDLDRDVASAALAKMGLEVVAIVAVDEVWSALRCKRV